MIKKNSLLIISLLLTNACVVNWDGQRVDLAKLPSDLGKALVKAVNPNSGKIGKQERLNRQLVQAIKNNDAIDVVQAIGKGADVNHTIDNYDNDRPLHLAMKYASDSIIGALVNNDADIYYENKNGDDALDLAYLYGHYEIMRALHDEKKMKIKGDINALFGRVLSNYLSSKKAGMLSCVQFLLNQNGINPNYRITDGNNKGKTFLHLIALYEKEETGLAQMLIAKGADVNATDAGNENVTPRDYAEVSENSEIANLLAKNGGKITAYTERKREEKERARREAEERARREAEERASGALDLICLKISIYNDVPDDVEITHPPYNERSQCTVRKYATGTWTYKFNVREAGLINRPIRNSCSGSIDIDASNLKYHVELYFSDWRSCQAKVRPL